MSIQRPIAKASAPPPAFHLKRQCPWKAQLLSSSSKWSRSVPPIKPSLFPSEPPRKLHVSHCWKALHWHQHASTCINHSMKWLKPNISAVVACCKKFWKTSLTFRIFGQISNIIWIWYEWHDLIRPLHVLDGHVLLSRCRFSITSHLSAAEVVSQGSVVPPCSRPLLLLRGRVQLPGVLHPWLLGVTRSIMCPILSHHTFPLKKEYVSFKKRSKNESGFRIVSSRYRGILLHKYRLWIIVPPAVQIDLRASGQPPQSLDRKV